MQISWLGYSSFRIQNDGITVITDPYDQASGFKINKQNADIVIASDHGEENADAVSGRPFLISGPGEYEIKSIFVSGVTANGKTMYVITIDAISIAFIGAVKIKELTDLQ